MMQNKLVEKIARIIAPDLFDADTEAYLDRLSGKPCDNWAASRGEMKHGMSIGTKRKEARTKAQAAIAAVEAEGWKTMDSAPRDGTQFLAYLSNGWIVILSERTGEDRYGWYQCSSNLSIPIARTHPAGSLAHSLIATHWRHLPAAPEVE